MVSWGQQIVVLNMILSVFFKFAGEIRDIEFTESDILVSYDRSSLFLNALALDEIIQILVGKAFNNNWFSTTYELNITKSDLSDLLKVAMKDQLFQFNANLYEQVAGSWQWDHCWVLFLPILSFETLRNSPNNKEK